MKPRKKSSAVVPYSISTYSICSIDNIEVTPVVIPPSDIIGFLFGFDLNGGCTWTKLRIYIDGVLTALPLAQSTKMRYVYFVSTTDYPSGTVLDIKISCDGCSGNISITVP